MGEAKLWVCLMTEANFFMMGVAGLALWSAIVAVFEIKAAWERSRRRQRDSRSRSSMI